MASPVQPSPPAAPAPTGTWTALRNPLFRSLWIANVASQIGSTMHDTGAVWLMSTLTTSATLVALMQTVSSLPLFLLALPAGALADIVDRRKMILWSQIASLVVAFALAAVGWGGWITPPLLLGLTFLLAIGNAFTLPAWQALIPTIVSRTDLPGALTLGSLGINVARGIGPVLGGLIIGASGPAAVFVLNALSFIGIIFVIVRARGAQAAPKKHPEQVLGAMVAALRFTRHSREVQAVLVRNAAFVFFGIAAMALLPIIVRNRQLSATDFGLLMGAYGVGGIFSAAFLLQILRRHLTVDHILTISTILLAAITFAIGHVSDKLLLCGLLFVGGAMWLTGMSTFSVSGQSLFPNWVRARASAVQLVAVQAALATGALVWGKTTATWNAPLALQMAAAGLALTAVFSWILPLTAALRREVSPSDHWIEHPATLQVPDSAGPITVTVEYRVRAEDSAAFIAAADKLREIRLRDGAYEWFLNQDIENPTRFSETFCVATWVEHLRQHERATLADREIEDAVIRFHDAAAGPVKITHQIRRATR